MTNPQQLLIMDMIHQYFVDMLTSCAWVGFVQ